MANVAADLRQATLAVLRSWCRDFGLKPQGKKDDVIRQLSAHLGGEVQVLLGDPAPAPFTALRRRCRLKTRESLAPVVAPSLPESRKRKLSADMCVQTNLAACCDMQSPLKAKEPRPEKHAETKKRQQLNARRQSEERCAHQEPEAECKNKHAESARCPRELKAQCAKEQVHSCKELDGNCRKATADGQHQQEPETEIVLERLGDHSQTHAIQHSQDDFVPSHKLRGRCPEKQHPKKETVAKRHRVPDANRQKERLHVRQKLETKRENEEEEMSLLQVLEAKYKDDDAWRQKAQGGKQLTKGNEVSQQHGQCNKEEMCLFQCKREEQQGSAGDVSLPAASVQGQCNKKEMSLLQVLEAKYKKQGEEHDARRQTLQEERLTQGNAVGQQQAERREEESCFYLGLENACRNDGENTRCQNERKKNGNVCTEAELVPEAELQIRSGVDHGHSEILLGLEGNAPRGPWGPAGAPSTEAELVTEAKLQVRSGVDHGHAGIFLGLEESRHQESETKCCKEVEFQYEKEGLHHYEDLRPNCKQDKSQLQVRQGVDKYRENLAFVSTPQKGRTGNAGRQWRSQWRRLSLLPAPEVPSSLSPLPGGDVWAAAAMQQRAAEEGQKNALASPEPEENQSCSGPGTPGCPRIRKGDMEQAMTGSLVEDSEPGFFDYGQVPTSQAAKKLVALSVAAAEMDETARCARLVDLATGMIHALPDGRIVAIGRSTGCDIVLAFPIIDRRHCVLLCKDGHVVVEDVGSKETFVNEMLVPRGDLLPQRVPLLRGDTLALGHPDGPKFLFLDAGRHTASS
eukprot:TRINITY_DN706_c0_g1_i2.p1 TRINITY_DN706_c0_g1~~TRINITY_DN706_c0_g1_i2.p1  ORF type:complete len:816 (+),score=172.40 TRINITY_DN706_c0_g1_i2:50-2449(+)